MTKIFISFIIQQQVLNLYLIIIKIKNEVIKMADEKSLLDTQLNTGEDEAPAPKKRGRKPGSKNKPKAEKEAKANSVAEKSKRGRKPKNISETQTAEKPKAKRGRKPKSEAAQTTSAEPKKRPGRPTSKTAEKKTTNKEPKTNIFIEYEGRSILAKDVLARSIKAYKKFHRGVEIKRVELYIKPEENAAYYVINGDMSPSYKVEL